MGRGKFGVPENASYSPLKKRLYLGAWQPGLIAIRQKGGNDSDIKPPTPNNFPDSSIESKKKPEKLIAIG
jgi:hypothetical protein